VFLKAADPEHAALNAKMGGLFNEPRLFACGVDLPIEHPLAFATQIDEPGLDYILVMEDVVARGGDPRDATRPLTVDQVANGLRGLARFHSRFWDSVDQEPDLDWVTLYRPWPGMGPAVPIAQRRLADTLPAAVRSLTAEQLLDDHWARFIGSLTTSPRTLLHGDPHVGNTYVLPDDTVGFLDWQVVREGNWSLDVGYFLQGALTEEDRRTHERELVESYRSQLDLRDAERPGTDEAWLRYRASAAHGLAMWLVTAADPGGWQRPEVSKALAERYATAFVELDTPGALDTLV
jgi:hypothetical protein